MSDRKVLEIGSGRQFGKFLDNFKKFHAHLMNGESILYEAPEYVMMPREMYQDILNTRPNDAKWIRVEDELPETGQIVIAFEPHCLNNPDMGMTLVVVDDTFHEVKRHDGKPWVTHWMPMSAPPKQSSEGEEE